jgi:exonuclease III
MNTASVLSYLGKAVVLFLLTSILSSITHTMPSDIQNSLNGLSLSCINANSLNMSSSNKPIQLKKIFGILKLRSDIILVADVRLSNCNLISSKNDVTAILRNNQYGSYTPVFNSTKNKRGVGIFFNNNLCYSVEESCLDPEENYIISRVKLKGMPFIFGAVYGPNSHDENFFVNLSRDLSRLGNHPIILGGDWNTVFSPLPSDSNPDCINMATIPNERHSRYLNNLCLTNSLTDPFRALFPNARDFSYVPRRTDRYSRSRIDFFLISDSLIPECSNCVIADNLQSALFDHKAVLLNFKSCSALKTYNRCNNVSNKILKDPDVDIIVDIACKECHLFYQDIDPLLKRRLLSSLGQARANLRNAGPDLKFYNLDYTEERIRNRDILINRINVLRFQDEIRGISNVRVNIDPDVFFDMLLNHVKNELISYQIFIFSLLGREKRETRLRLLELKKNHSINRDLIFELENKLKIISEQAIERALAFHPLFDHIAGEKMSPHFLSLVKGSKSDASLSDICDDSGTVFRTDELREEYIVRYFEKIYQVPENSPVDFDNLIENFLGPEICNHPLVQNSKLNAFESNALNVPLSLFELDVSAEEGNEKTAAGPDGISNAFVKKFWQHFRIPLHANITFCFNRKRLPDNFATANIRLIPKKGDKKNIKNWRPISLLSCFYKVISRAVNNRFKKISDRFTSRAQKGFTPNRHIQEVIINLTESMAYCRSNNISGALVSIDLAKAFDTILHGFVRASYKFFGVGEPFLDMMDTIGTGRYAQILTNGGKTSRKFALGTGRPQGDTVSPNQFNTGDQILIFKIELDPRITSVFDNMLIPRNNYPVDRNLIPLNYRFESNAEKDKVDGFADDASGITEMKRDPLSALKEILNDFSEISNLKCNYDKTQVMHIGNTNANCDFVEELGFTLVNEITVLGFILDKDGLKNKAMFNKVKKNIAGIVVNWARFKLSLPGRIGIYKNLLLSQLGYVGSIANPDPPLLEEIQSLMTNFVIGNSRMSKERLFLQADKGGLGLTNLKNFLIGLQAVWVKKAHESTRDNWRVDLHSMSLGNCFACNLTAVAQDRHPILATLVASFNTFTGKFFRDGCNFWEMYICNNSLVTRNLNNNLLLDSNFFQSNVPRLNLEQVSQLKFKDFFTGNNFKSLDEVINDTNINFSLLTYMRLREAIMSCKNKYFSGNRDGNCVSLEQFFRPKKGCAKKIRLFLDKNNFNKEISCITTVKSFLRITGLELTSIQLQFLYGLWNNSHLPNYLRDFFFSFVNNSLPLNTRLSHYVENVNRNCTFCGINLVINPPEESFLHLFWSCPTSRVIHDWFRNKYFVFIDGEDAKKYFFLSGTILGSNCNLFGAIVMVIIQYLIWEMKRQKRVLAPLTLDNDFRFILKGIHKNFPKLRSSVTHSGKIGLMIGNGSSFKEEYGFKAKSKKVPPFDTNVLLSCFSNGEGGPAAATGAAAAITAILCCCAGTASY